MEDLANNRRQYSKKSLSRSELPADPFQLLKGWLQEANGQIDFTSMTLSTIGLDGYPNSRVVLLKGIEAGELVFYTNYNSEKGKEIAKNPVGALLFYWPELEKQIRLKGDLHKTSEYNSEEYFNSRPFESKVGALVSKQSEVIANRDQLDHRYRIALEEWESKEVPKPESWGGYSLRPKEMEFWQGRDNRLHDRFRYVRQGVNWQLDRLSP